MHVADLLSRNFDRSEDSEKSEDFNEIIHSINVNLDRKLEIVKETLKDPILVKIIAYCKTGWPDKGKFPLKTFYKYRNEIYYMKMIFYFMMIE